MAIFSKQTKTAEEVFTPRAAEVNHSMYINRPDLEQSLIRGVRTKYHVVIYGDSGCGKSWLYKKVFRDNNIFYDILDFSGAENADDVDLQILDAVSGYDEFREVNQEETIEVHVSPARMGTNTKTTKKFERIERSALGELMHRMRLQAKRKRAILVLENIEHVLDKPHVVNQIQKMLLALDTPALAKYKVTLCLVGVPSEIKDILTDSNKFQTISNRVTEIPEVERLSREGIGLLALRGFEQELELTIESKEYCTSQVAFYSDRIPQFVHDICLHAALLSEDNFLKITPQIIDAAAQYWMETNTRQSYEFICACLERTGPMTEAAGRVAFAIGLCEQRYFQATDINERVMPS